MTENNANRQLKRQPLYPGEILREEVLPAIGFSVTPSTNLSHY